MHDFMIADAYLRLAILKPPVLGVLISITNKHGDKPRWWLEFW